MDYNMYFDVAAILVIGTIIIHYLFKKNISTYQTRVFCGLMSIGFLSALADYISVEWYTILLGLPPFYNYFINILYLVCFNILTPMYFYYICLVVKKRSEFGTGWKCLLTLPVAVDVLLITTTPLTKLVFYFDEANTYSHGPGIAIVYLIACYYLICCLVFVRRYRESFAHEQRVAVYFFTVTLLVAIVLQVTLLKGIMVTEFAAALSVLMVYLSLEDPDDYIDKRIGAYNRNAFIKVVSSYLETGKHFELLGVQVVGFQFINDTIGVNNGNTLMKQAADIIRKAAGHDRVFRISGTRYVIVSQRRGISWDATVKAIHDQFSEPFLVQELEISLTALMCKMSCPDNVQTLEDILATLESTYAEFEQEGDGGLVTVSEEARNKKQREHALLQVMRNALTNGEFKMVYQPIYSVEKGRFTCAEALLRLTNKEFDRISPEVFIPLAEKNGLILEIGEFVFRDVCRFIASHDLNALGIEYVEINLSVIQCMQEKLHETLIQIVEEYGVPYTCINLEITETAAVVSSDTLKSNMGALKAKGVTFALDDYGTGYSTTSSLISYPFHIIKLDKSMVWSAFEDPKALCALKYTIAMIQEMKMKIVAEGIETLDQAQALTAMGCDYFQGYYYAHPMQGEQFLELLGTKAECESAAPVAEQKLPVTGR